MQLRMRCDQSHHIRRHEAGCSATVRHEGSDIVIKFIRRASCHGVWPQARSFGLVRRVRDSATLSRTPLV